MKPEHLAHLGKIFIDTFELQVSALPDGEAKEAMAAHAKAMHDAMGEALAAARAHGLVGSVALLDGDPKPL